MTRIANNRRLAFTLVELAVSATVMSILTVGLASSILLASKALPDTSRSTYRIMATSQVADQLITELQEARNITECTATAVTFTVADRDGDGSPETIRYTWGGNVNDSLTRQYNHGTATTVLEGVHQFALTYDMRDEIETYPGPLVEGAEELLSIYDGSEDRKNFSVDAEDWIGQYFRPTPPDGAISWKVTRVVVRAKDRGKTDGETAVQLRTADADNLPSSTVLEQHIMYESILGSTYSWQEFAFSGVFGLTPGDGLCLVLQYLSGENHSARIKYDADGGAGGLGTTNAGGSWELYSESAMLHYIYGTWSAPGPDQSATRQYITGIRINLQSGSDDSTAIETGVRMWNTPEVLSAVWEVDFDTDPTVLDMNGDDSGDWAVADGGSFDSGSLSDGVWDADTALNTIPNNDFTDLTTVEVRFRNTNPGGNAAYFQINADWAASQYAPIAAIIMRQPDATQTMTVTGVDSGGSQLDLVTIPGLPRDFVTLRLLIDPSLDTVNVRANGVDYGTYAYGKISPSMNDRFISIMPIVGEAEFDSVSVRVKGTP